MRNKRPGQLPRRQLSDFQKQQHEKVSQVRRPPVGGEEPETWGYCRAAFDRERRRFVQSTAFFAQNEVLFCCFLSFLAVLK